MKFRALLLSLIAFSVFADSNYRPIDSPPTVDRCQRLVSRQICQATCGCSWDSNNHVCDDGESNECNFRHIQMDSNTGVGEQWNSEVS